MTEQFANTILNKLFELSTKIDTVATVVKRHDESTFPEIQKELKSQSNALFRMESKQNKDILQFIDEKEKIHTRLVPLEEHVKNSKKVNAEDRKTWLEVLKHSATSTTTLILAWVAYKLGIIQK